MSIRPRNITITCESSIRIPSDPLDGARVTLLQNIALFCAALYNIPFNNIYMREYSNIRRGLLYIVRSQFRKNHKLRKLYEMFVRCD